MPIFICQAGARLASFQMCLTRFGADDLFIELWFHCHDNRARGQGGWELFLDLCCNVKLIGKVSASLGKTNFRQAEQEKERHLQFL